MDASIHCATGSHADGTSIARSGMEPATTSLSTVARVQVANGSVQQDDRGL